MPTKIFHLSGPLGVMAIGAYGTNADALTNPLSYLSQLNFHSDLEYMRIQASLAKSVCSFPGLIREVIYWDEGSKGCGGGC